MAPSSKCSFCALPQPPNISSTVKRFTFGKSFAYFCSNAAERGRSDFGTLLDVEDLVPGAEYTLWIFSNNAIDPDHIPAALTHSIARWTAEPPLGSTILQTITTAILVDPDGKPHSIKPNAIGANTIEPQTEPKAKS